MTEEEVSLAESTPEPIPDAPSEPVAEVAPEPEVVPVEESIPVAERMPEILPEPASLEPEFGEETPPPPPSQSTSAPQSEPKTVPPAPVPPPPAVPPAPKKSSRSRMLEVVRARKAERLEKIVVMAREKRVITNDDVEKLLKVSDSTATRYLNTLVLSTRLRRSGSDGGVRYEPV